MRVDREFRGSCEDSHLLYAAARPVFLEFLTKKAFRLSESELAEIEKNPRQQIGK
jgi:hypothetical protein